MITENCITCGKEFKRKPYDIKHKYCSRECSNVYKKGHIPWVKGKTKEMYPNINWGGREKNCVTWNKGLKLHPLSEEHKNKIKLGVIKTGASNTEEFKNKLSERMSGEKNIFWKYGEFKFYKKILLKQKDYTCSVCGLKDKEIVEVDHIIPKAIKPELYHELANLQILCPNCHRRKTKLDRIDIKNFKKNLNNKIKQI